MIERDLHVPRGGWPTLFRLVGDFDRVHEGEVLGRQKADDEPALMIGLQSVERLHERPIRAARTGKNIEIADQRDPVAQDAIRKLCN